MAENRLNKFNLLNVQVSAIDMAKTCSLVVDAVSRRQKKYICVCPVSTIMECKRNNRVLTSVNSADLATPDGMPLVWIGKMFGYKNIRRVYGPELMESICDISRKKGYKNYLYGSSEDVLNKLKINLVKRYPGLVISGSYSPPFRRLSEEEDSKIVENINDNNADIVWVGLGSPKQDLWMYEHRGKINAPLMIGVGAAFDFLAGVKPQAPSWIRNNGFEWLFRLITEPNRLWRRYLVDIPLFIYHAGAELILKVFVKHTVLVLKLYSNLFKFKIKHFFADRIRLGRLRNRVLSIEKYKWSFQATFQCNFRCSYCVQRFGSKDIPVQAQRVDAIGLDRFLQLNNLSFFVDCLVIQGGEPLLVGGLDGLVSKLTKFKKIIIVSNLSLPVENFIGLKDKINYDLKFIGSYHPEFSDLQGFIDKAVKLKNVNMLQYCCMVDRSLRENMLYMREFLKKGINLALYSYVGMKKGRVYPRKARFACTGLREKAMCRTGLVLISANGKVFNCHTKMYMDKDEVCTIDNINNFAAEAFECRDFGICHPCQADDVVIWK